MTDSVLTRFLTIGALLDLASDMLGGRYRCFEGLTGLGGGEVITIDVAVVGEPDRTECRTS